MHSLEEERAKRHAAFPQLSDEKKDFLDRYCEIAYRIFERIERDPEARKQFDYIEWQKRAKCMVDSVQKRAPNAPSAIQKKIAVPAAPITDKP